MRGCGKFNPTDEDYFQKIKEKYDGFIAKRSGEKRGTCENRVLPFFS